MDLHELSDRLTAQIDGLRDRTADALGADGGSLFKELHKLGRQIDGVESHLVSRIDDLEEAQEDSFDLYLGSDKRTTWPRRIFWLLLGAGAGAAAAYLADPDRGRARRQEIGTQVTSTATDLKNQATQQANQAVQQAKGAASDLKDEALQQASQTAEQAKDAASELATQAADQATQVAQEAKGAAIETAKDATPDTPTDDPGLLRDKIESTVFGYRDDVQDVVIKVDGPGRVALKGTVPSPTNERELLAAVAEVEGVIDVRSELSVRTI